jgi:hypothetical protein
VTQNGGIDAHGIAQILITAERERTGIPQISDDHPDVDTATAYRAQQLSPGWPTSWPSRASSRARASLSSRVG